MSIYRDKATGQWRFDFDKRIRRPDGGSERIRRRQLLPPGWTRAQADAFDRKESAALYALATGVAKPRHTIDQAVACYKRERCGELKAGENAKRELDATSDWWTGRAIEELPAVCAEYAAAQLGALAPATIKNRISYLRAACRWAWKTHNMGQHDPGERATMPAVRNERHRYIGRRDVLRLAREIGHLDARAVVLVAFYSGMRLSECLRARPEAGRWVLDDTKNGERRVVPIHPKTAHLAERWPREVPARTVQSWFLYACRRLGIADLRFHDLRHSAASAMINAGVPVYTVGAVLGHKAAASTKRYSHLDTAALAEAVKRIG